MAGPVKYIDSKAPNDGATLPKVIAADYQHKRGKVFEPARPAWPSNKHPNGLPGGMGQTLADTPDMGDRVLNEALGASNN